VTSTTHHGSMEARDVHVANGMQSGIVESHERLDDLLAAHPGT
jgi:hypothetical protein